MNKKKAGGQVKHLYTHSGMTMTILEWARYLGLTRAQLVGRINKRGFEFAVTTGDMTEADMRALNPPVVRKRRSRKKEESKPVARKPHAYIDRDNQAWRSVVIDNDPDYELKNRLAAYQKLGMTRAEILTKARLI